MAIRQCFPVESFAEVIGGEVIGGEVIVGAVCCPVRNGRCQFTSTRVQPIGDQKSLYLIGQPPIPRSVANRDDGILRQEEFPPNERHRHQQRRQASSGSMI